jgi:hypothetical protein
LEDEMLGQCDRLRELLLRELRGAVAAKVDSGADPDEVTADLVERIRSVRQLRRPSRA